MRNEPTHNDADRPSGPQIREALACLEQVVLDGAATRSFPLCDFEKGNRRELVIEAGKSHKFTIPEDELPR